MFGDVVWYLVYVAPWVTAGIGVAAGAVLERRRALVLLGGALAATGAALLLGIGIATADDARQAIESIAAAPLVGLWQLPTYALGAALARGVRGAVRRGRTRP